MVRDSRGNAAWRRPAEGEAAVPAALEASAVEENAGAAATAGPAATEAAAATFAPGLDVAETVVADKPGPPARSWEHEPGSPMPRSWLMVLAGAVMGGILSIALYSQAVGSSNGNTGFGGPGGGRAGFGQAGPGQGQGGVPNGGFAGAGGAGQGQLPNRNGAGGQANGQANGAGQGQVPQFSFLPRPPDLSGSIRTVTTRNLTVDTPQGTRVVEYDSDTQVFLSDGSSGSASDLTRGAVIAVVTSTDPNTRLLRADAIGVLR
jgi:hypothetical protein